MFVSLETGDGRMSMKHIFVVEENFGGDDGWQPSTHMTIRTEKGEISLISKMGDFIPVVFFKKEDAIRWWKENLVNEGVRVVKYVPEK